MVLYTDSQRHLKLNCPNCRNEQVFDIKHISYEILLKMIPLKEPHEEKVN